MSVQIRFEAALGTAHSYDRVLDYRKRFSKTLTCLSGSKTAYLQSFMAGGSAPCNSNARFWYAKHLCHKPAAFGISRAVDRRFGQFDFHRSVMNARKSALGRTRQHENADHDTISIFLKNTVKLRPVLDHFQTH
jgi:hypothetical protein